MSVSYVEREQAGAETLAFYDKAEERFQALLDLTVQIGEDANRVSDALWQRLHAHWSEAEIVDAVFVITIYIAVSKFGDALGVELESMFDGVKPILRVEH